MAVSSQLSFQINPSSGEPIYRQLFDQIKRLISSGYLKPGEEMPSVRQLAASLTVNPMTISKSYSLLETVGLLERRRGKGMFVSAAGDHQQDHQNRLRMLRPALEEAATQGRQLALQDKEMIALFTAILKESHHA